jgi:hypothetical protein
MCKHMLHKLASEKAFVHTCDCLHTQQAESLDTRLNVALVFLTLTGSKAGQPLMAKVTLHLVAYHLLLLVFQYLSV